ncbi:AAA family ATPase [Pseudonocardia xishanensis]|uniref:MoxR family ATPase n=1 Tax=Pseudonocardia xishanensis TaxID=630995 RepID=A0ABP8RV87_9PSEU
MTDGEGPTSAAHPAFASVAAVRSALAERRYIADEGLSRALFLAVRMGRPILLEGAAGVGKTQIAKTLTEVLDVPLVRLQCYEGIDAAQALYEWDYPRQLLALRLGNQEAGRTAELENVYSQEFLLERPLLSALRMRPAPVLLIDELDRADEEFEAFLLETLSEFAVSIPELGEVRAASPPVVVITSNRTRELHDALKRRCYYHWIDYPSIERETEIIELRVPDVGHRLARSVAETVSRIRGLGLTKLPGAAEAIDWAHALSLLNADDAEGDEAVGSLGAVVKSPEDLPLVADWLSR